MRHKLSKTTLNKRARMARNPKTKKNNGKSKKQLNKMQIGGSGNITSSPSGLSNVAFTIEEFIDIINGFEKFDNKQKADDGNKPLEFGDLSQNTYYTRLISMIPCAIRLRDYRFRNTPYEYVFNAKLELLSKTAKMNDDEIVFGQHDSIYCQKNNDLGYKIIMIDNTNFLNDLCQHQVQLVHLVSINRLSKPGHAIILLLNHKDKQFSVIDPNGIDGAMVDGDLDYRKFAEMLGKILTTYTYMKIVFPPCQRMSVFFQDSCLIWSLLFTEFIVRFGLENAKSFFFSQAPINADNLIRRYANYIKKVLSATSSREDVFIYSPYYKKAEEIRSRIADVNRNVTSTDIYKTRNRNENIIIQHSNIIISLLGWDGWILELTNPANRKKYIVKSTDVDMQILSTLIMVYEPNFTSLMDILTNPGSHYKKTNPFIQRVGYI